jgi:hypothetical protein
MQAATNALHNQENRNIRHISQDEAQHNKHKHLILAAVT